MFQSLTEKLGTIFDGLRGRTALSEEDVDLALREIRVALLEADVALPVVKDFMATVREKAVGQAIVKSVSPTQLVVKIVNDAMVTLLGGDLNQNLQLDVAPPAVILMAGLQGSGKTTSTGKLAKFLRTKQNKKVLLASLDVHRPAAQDQLRIIGEQIDIATLPIIKGENPLQITERALHAARIEAYDVLILDTAGRLAIDAVLMDEVAAVHALAKPVETLLVVDAMTGQDAVATATAFDQKLGVTGIILTRVDGDARGGAAMSMRAVTGKPIKFMGIGEKLDALEPFHADRIAGRILGMGDVVSLVEKAIETIDRGEAEAMAKKMQEGQFDLDDFASQLTQMRKMGGMGSMMKLLPGLSRFAPQIETANVDNTVLKKQEAILNSMTRKERAKPDLILASGSRRRRIAIGSGTTVQDVNRLMKQFEQMQTMMKKMRKMGMGGLMGMAKNLMGDQTLGMLTKGAGAEADMQEFLAQNPIQGGLGANPFLPGGGRPQSFFTKSKKGKRK